MSPTKQEMKAVCSKHNDNSNSYSDGYNGPGITANERLLKKPLYQIVEESIKSANIHLIGQCNMHCAFCFDRCLPKAFMEPREWVPVLDHLKRLGIEKINLAGGEPTLYPYLDEMVDIIKSYGFTVSIVSNGSQID